jgi:hypothetical protein
MAQRRPDGALALGGRAEVADVRVTLDAQPAFTPGDRVQAGIERHLAGDVVDLVRDGERRVTEERVGGAPPQPAVSARQDRGVGEVAAPGEAEHFEQFRQHSVAEQVVMQPPDGGDVPVGRVLDIAQVAGGEFGDPGPLRRAGQLEGSDQRGEVAVQHGPVVGRLERGPAGLQEGSHAGHGGHPPLDVRHLVSGLRSGGIAGIPPVVDQVAENVHGRREHVSPDHDRCDRIGRAGELKPAGVPERPQVDLVPAGLVLQQGGALGHVRARRRLAEQFVLRSGRADSLRADPGHAAAGHVRTRLRQRTGK